MYVNYVHPKVLTDSMITPRHSYTCVGILVENTVFIFSMFTVLLNINYFPCVYCVVARIILSVSCTCVYTIKYLLCCADQIRNYYVHLAETDVFLLPYSRVLKAAIAVLLRGVVRNAPLVITVGMVLTLSPLHSVIQDNSVQGGSLFASPALRVRLIITLPECICLMQCTLIK